MNAWDTMRQAVREAEATMNAADSVAGQMARLLRGRLVHASPDTCAALKRELRGFDAHRKTWK